MRDISCDDVFDAPVLDGGTDCVLLGAVDLSRIDRPDGASVPWTAVDVLF